VKTPKIKLIFLFIGLLAILAGADQASGQGARFFRVSGAAATAIISFNPDGTLVWSNVLAGTNYTIQTVASLPGGTNWVDYVQIPTTNGINTNLLWSFNPPADMALIPAGTFTMGDVTDGNDDGNAAATSIYVSAFYMDVNLVSSNQWAAVYNCATNQGYSFAHAGAAKAGNYPVETVDWYDCVKWSNARSAQGGLTPVYYTDAGFTQVFTNGDYGTTVYANWSASGYRLPTEAEWEKAARGGLSGQRFPWGDTISWSQANYYGCPAAYGGCYSYDLATAEEPDPAYSGPSPVGSFRANGFGLYDMAGNVLEWCWDWYGIPYGQPSSTNPTGLGTGSLRVLRGGDWDDPAHHARCSCRFCNDPDLGAPLFGFRCVRGL
jgi:formylglycine-generating enzyme required for sulfatase activity